MMSRQKHLALDIGNTRTKMGLLEEGRLLAKTVVHSGEKDKIRQWLTNHPAENIIFCTVTGSAQAQVSELLPDARAVMALDSQTPLPITNQYRTPETLGKDRLAAVVGAFYLFPRQNCLIVDAGTCITLDVLTAQGHYLGGNIAPGIDMRLKAMYAFTAGLPLVERPQAPGRIGNSTVSALQNGAANGALLEIEGFSEWCRQQYGALNVILTGGDAVFFEKNLKSKIFVNQDLVLLGLDKILTYNVEC